MNFALVISYYENSGILALHYASVAKEADVEFIVTDDGSAIVPAMPSIDVRLQGRHKVFRILGEKKAWGHNVCRNVGCTESSAPWIIVTDADHVVPAGTWRWLRDNVKGLDRRKPYRFLRVNAPDGSPYHRHPDTHLIHRSFWEKCPFDEAGRGFYGQNSLVLEAFMRAAGMRSESEIEVLPTPIIRYSRDVLPDASTTQFERKSQANKDAMKKIRAAKAARGMTGIPERLGVPYERVFA